MSQSYQIAIIQNGTVIKVYDQQEYNQQVIAQYRNSNQQAPQEPKLYVEPVQQTKNQVIKNEQNLKTESVGGIIQSKTEPLKTLFLELSIIFVIMIISLVIIKIAAAPKNQKRYLAMVQLFGIIMIAWAVFGFIKA